VRASRTLIGRRAWVLVAAAIAAAIPLGASTLSSAQTLPSLTVNKVVTGAVPPGTTFTVTIVCTTVAVGSTGSTTPSSVTPQTIPPTTTTTVTFDAHGDPTPAGSNVVSPSTLPSACTVTETATGGAQSTSYTCAVGSSTDTTCAADQQTVDYGPDASGASATVTVTNSFPPPVIAATFTG
jgi:hypothetical protein